MTLLEAGRFEPDFRVARTAQFSDDFAPLTGYPVTGGVLRRSFGWSPTGDVSSMVTGSPRPPRLSTVAISGRSWSAYLARLVDLFGQRALVCGETRKFSLFVVLTGAPPQPDEA